MAPALDFIRAKVLAYKHTLEGKSSKEKERHIAIQIAVEFNSFIEEIKKEAPEAAPHLPKSITSKGIAAQDMQLADVRFLDLEMLLNQVLAVLDVVRGGG